MRSVNADSVIEHLLFEAQPFCEESIFDEQLVPLSHLVLSDLQVSILACPLQVSCLLELTFLLLAEILLQLSQVNFTSILAHHGLQSLSIDAN